MKHHTKITIAEHVALGNALKLAWQAVQTVRRTCPKASRAWRAADRTERALVSLKSALDDDVCAQVPRTQDPRHLATRVYYGSQPFVPDDQHRSRNDPADAFRPWSPQPEAEGAEAKG